MQTTPETPASPLSDPGPRRLTRSSSDRIIGGVAGGVGRYFGIDPTLVRIGFFALALLGGTGLVVYAAALLLVPLDDETAGAPRTARDRGVAIAVAAALIIAALVFGSFGFIFGGALVPLAFLALAGLAVWWFVSGERPSGSPSDVVRRAVQGVGLLLGCGALAVASFFGSGLGGGVVIAGIVIAAGAGLVAAAFIGGARWLVLPALAIALPLAFVSAAGIDLDGGFGKRHEHPATLADMQHGYRLGAGELIVDLRDLKLPSGDHPLNVRIGVGHALVLVPKDVCVASAATVGIGGVAVFDHAGGGMDVDWNDGRLARADTARLVVDADVGLGLLEVAHSRTHYNDRGPWDRTNDPSERNAACATPS